MRLLLCVSGGLGLSALKSIPSGLLAGVFTDKNSVEIISWSNTNAVPVFIGNPRNKLIEATKFVNKIAPDWLLSVNYLFILPAEILTLLDDKAINIHGSLLPKYRGRTPHVWAIINGETESGITAHFIVPEVDAGDIIEQIRIPISESMSGAELLAEYNKEYPVLLSRIIEQISKNTIVRKVQDHSKATYFPKRTPEDGRINWDWHVDRIINWVRALRPPYPGAFNDSSAGKIVFDNAAKNELGFGSTDNNGTVMESSSDSVIVKAQNGCTQLTLVGKNLLKKGEVLK